MNMDDVIWRRLMHYFSSRVHWRVVNAFQWLPILSDLRSMSLWEGDEERLVHFGSNVSASRNTKRSTAWEWDVSTGRGNLLGFGLLSPYSAFKNESQWLSLTYNDMARRDHWGKTTYSFHGVVQLSPYPALSNGVSAARWRKRWFVMHFLCETLSANKTPLGGPR